MNSTPRSPYPTDVTDEQWALLEPLLPPAKSGGRPREVPLREVVNALFYQNRTGCQWDLLPHDLLPKSTVYDYFAEWRDDGTWFRLVDALRSRVRSAAGREPTPSAACIDSQTVKTASGGERGYDGGKKISGRKRHILVDTLGLLLVVVVTSAAADDGAAAPQVLEQAPVEAYPRLVKIFGDRKYRNHDLERWLKTHRPAWELEITRRPPDADGFVPVPKRWVVERTFAWLGRARRLSKDYERFPESSAARVQLSALHHLLRRLAPPAKAAPEFHYRLAA